MVSFLFLVSIHNSLFLFIIYDLIGAVYSGGNVYFDIYIRGTGGGDI